MKKRSMAFEVITSSAKKCADGLHDLEAELGTAQNTEARMRQDISRAVTAQNQYREAIATALAATRAQQAVYDQAFEYIAYARDVLKRTIGWTYSEEWGTAGFLDHSLRVPRTLGGRLMLLKSLELYFLGHPEAEVAEINVTHARAAELHQLLGMAIFERNKARAEQRQKKSARDAAVTALRKRMQGLRAELNQLMEKDDPRWLQFGFDVPADVHVPAAPEGVTLTQEAVTDHVKVSWNHTAHADRFRIFQRVIGTDAEPVLRDTTTETSFDLGTFVSGTHLEVLVTAINLAGESVSSESVEIVVT